MKQLINLRRWLVTHDGRVVALAAVILSLVYTTYYYLRGDILAYGDAESHLNIAKRVVGGLTPGFGQLGGNWLPLHHLLMAPFVWNNWLWHTGLGGSVVSMVAFVASAYFIYRLGEHLTGSKGAGLVAAAIFGLNPNVAYMQSVPMSELPLLAALLGAVYYLVRWADTEQVIYLVMSSLLALAGTLIRYDAWFVIVIELGLVVLIGLLKRWPWAKIEGSALLFALPAFLGVLLWIGWNQLIFGDPLYFMNSAYSAKAQQQAFMARGQLLTLHAAGTSTRYYLQAVIDVAGAWTIFAALGGLVAVIVMAWRGSLVKRRLRLLAGLLVAAPLPFNILSLFLGISILFVPEVVPAGFPYPLFNARYGLMTLPLLALLCGFLYLALARLPRRVFSIIIPLQALVMITTATPITLADGLNGLSARLPGDQSQSANNYLLNHYDGGYVAFDDFAKVANPISIGVPMNRIIYVGNHPYWEDVENNPDGLASWLIIRQDDNDSLWQKLQHNPELTSDYSLVYAKNSTVIYERRTDIAVK